MNRTSPDFLRSQAERALRLAASFHIETVAATLRKAAADYLERAAAAEHGMADSQIKPETNDQGVLTAP